MESSGCKKLVRQLACVCWSDTGRPRKDANPDYLCSWLGCRSDGRVRAAARAAFVRPASSLRPGRTVANLAFGFGRIFFPVAKQAHGTDADTSKKGEMVRCEQVLRGGRGDHGGTCCRERSTKRGAAAQAARRITEGVLINCELEPSGSEMFCRRATRSTRLGDLVYETARWSHRQFRSRRLWCALGRRCRASRSETAAEKAVAGRKRWQEQWRQCCATNSRSEQLNRRRTTAGSGACPGWQATSSRCQQRQEARAGQGGGCLFRCEELF